MSPIQFLIALAVLTAGASIVQAVLRRRQMRILRRLAAEWGMHYTPRDRFRLAVRIAEAIPVPGAAGVRVLDIIYGTEEDRRRYFFTAEYTAGVLKKKTDHRRAGSFAEPKERAETGGALELRMGKEDLALIEQYRELRVGIGG
jgi:hypothetical protein